MKTVIGIVVAVIIVLGGGYLLTRHNKNHNSASSTSSTMQNMPNMSSNSSSSSSANSSAPVQTNTVTINNFAFSPANITVKKGTAVTWTNKDSVAHTVVENDGQTGPKSDNLNQGQTYSFTYTTAGTFKYHCSIHPNMTGTVTVTE